MRSEVARSTSDRLELRAGDARNEHGVDLDKETRADGGCESIPLPSQSMLSGRLPKHPLTVDSRPSIELGGSARVDGVDGDGERPEAGVEQIGKSGLEFEAVRAQAEKQVWMCLLEEPERCEGCAVGERLARAGNADNVQPPIASHLTHQGVGLSG